MWYWWIYLDYENCRCRKKLVDKLIEECTETIEEMTLTNIAFTKNGNNNYEHNSWMVYIILMIVVFLIFTRNAIYFVHYSWSLIKNNTHKNTEIW